MKVSIIIPTLNEEKYIGKLLHCLAHQQFKDFEVIIVDAFSDDNTCKIARSYKEFLRLRVIKTKKRNVAFQRNLGAKFAASKYLLFMDADVCIGPKFILQSLREIDKKKLSLAIPKYIPSDRRWYYSLFFGIINMVFFMMKNINPTGIGSCIFSAKKIHDNVSGFDEKLKWTDDMDYIKKGAKKNKFDVLPTRCVVSVRRFEKEGTKKIMLIWIKAYFLHQFGMIKSTNNLSYFSD